MKRLNNDLKYLIIIWVTLIIGIFITYGHHGHVLVDCGREVYYPTQILIGKILYKDIFNIYGPFSYMFNALLYKTFGIHLNVLYFSGCVCAFLIVNLIYLIAKKFLSEFLSFAVSIFTIAIGVLNLWLFNFIFPYSYAMLYGIVAFLTSVWLLLKYQESPDKNFFLYLSSFFAGVCITSKYEFLPYLIVLLYAILMVKPLKFKQYYFTAFSLFFVPIFCFGILFLQGLGISDLVSTAHILNKMAHSQTLKYFYTTQGVFFSKNTIGMLALAFIKTTIPIGFLRWGIKIERKTFGKSILSIGLIVLATLLMLKFVDASIFAFLPIWAVILTLILAVKNFKSLKENQKLSILILSGWAVSLKAFWGLSTLNYGVYFTSFLLITIIALLIEKSKYKNVKTELDQSTFGIYLITVAVILGWYNLSSLNINNHPIQTARGKIYSDESMSSATTELINYINKKTKKTDTVVIFPEGAMINYLTGRKSDNYYNSLIPLYVETFGEDKLIKHFQETKPEYVIFDNWNTGDYGQKYICSDYAISFCNYVAKNYTKEKVIDDGFRYLIFKKN